MFPSSVRHVLAAAAFSFVLIAAFSNSTQAQGYATGVLERMEDHNKSLQTLTADIQRVRTDSLLKIDTLDHSGSLSYVPAEGSKAYVFIKWRDPDEILLVVKSTFWFYKASIDQYYYGKIDKTDKAKGTNALAFLTKSKKELTEEFRPKWLGDVKVHGAKADHMRLEPKVKSSFEAIELMIDEKGLPLRVTIFEKNNDSETIGLSNVKENIRLSADIFKWRPPPDAKKIPV